jgi:hypothetical protein
MKEEEGKQRGREREEWREEAFEAEWSALRQTPPPLPFLLPLQ